MEVSPPYISKINSNYEKQIILSMIPNQKQESWNYLAMKRTICIVERNNLKNIGHSYCLNCLHSFGTKYKLKSHEKVCKNNV